MSKVFDGIEMTMKNGIMANEDLHEVLQRFFALNDPMLPPQHYPQGIC
ncbi:hypothetical protein U9M48_027574 [Paspalum notatum var. saurae]|uniref:Uncharacterized protein n=1 Tax=Paspalum notatum var. saurae TaxID=547442 RepID=A0AAQ3TV02_PASNO